MEITNRVVFENYCDSNKLFTGAVEEEIERKLLDNGAELAEAGELFIVQNEWWTRDARRRIDDLRFEVVEPAQFDQDSDIVEEPTFRFLD